MANVVNARDSQIQATTPRLNGVTLQSNVQVNQSNVSGLGLIVDATKQIWLSSTSQIFQIPKSGSTSPASITLTANVRNLTATPTLSIVAGSGSMSVTPALTSGAFTFTPAQMTSDTVTFRLSLTEDSKTYTYDLTVVKVREGIDSITAFLTNESVVLPGDSAGNVTSYTGASGNFKVFQGSNDVTSACTFSLVTGGNPDSLTYSLTASGASAGAFSVTAGYPTNKDITTLTFRATFGTTTVDKILTLTKAKSGAVGKQLSLNTSAQAFTFDSAGTASPATQTVTFTAVSQNLTGSPTFTATGYNAAGTSLGALTLGGTGNSRTLAHTAFGAAAYAVVQVTWDSITDQATIVRLKDGASGTSPVVGYLTNESVTVATAFDGTGATYTAAGGTFKVFDGLIDKTGNGVTYSVNSSSGVTISIASTGVYTVTGMSADTGTATLRAVYGTTTIDKVYNIAKAKAGTNGTNGSNGTNGARGSQTFYVSTSNTAWSDTLAATSASANGGPILNDLVVQYNNGANFSQSKFWNGSGWTLVNAVVDGNLLVSGSIGASKLTINGASNSIFMDPFIQDPSVWTQVSTYSLATITTVTDGVAGNRVLRSPGTTAGWADGSGARCVVTPGRKYRVSARVRRSADCNGKLYLRYVYWDNSGGAAATGQGVIGQEDVTVNTLWVQYSGTFTCPSSHAWIAPRIALNYNGTTGYMEAQDVRIEELIDSAVIVQGGITADRIDTKGLDIKDGAGNVIFSSGINLDWTRIGGTGKPQDGATVGAVIGTNLSGQFTAANISTYIANAAIGLAQINTASIGSLSALTANVGTLTMDATGYIGGGQTAYNTGTGFFLGYSGTAYKFSIGDGTNGLTWDGSKATFKGDIDVKSATSGARMEIKNNVIKVFDSAGILRVQIGDLAV